MKVIKRHILVFVVFISLFGFFLANSEFTGFSVLSGTLGLKAPSKLPSDSVLEGEINLTVGGVFSSSDKITLSIEDNEVELRLKYILDELNISYVASSALETASNPEDIKILDFDRAGSKAVGIRIRKVVDSIDRVSMNIEGKDSGITFPKRPRLDFGADGVYDWIYLGATSGYSSSAVYPLGLNQSFEEEITLGNSDVSFCERIEIGIAKDYRLSVKMGNDGADDVNLYVLDDLDKPQGICGISPIALDWYACNVQLDDLSDFSDGITVCMNFSGASSPSVKLAVESETSEITSSTCNNGVCSNSNNYDYYMRVFPAVFSDKLEGVVSLSDWEVSENAINESIQDYLDLCDEDSGGFCILPLWVTSDTAGILELSSLDFSASTLDGILIDTSKFYDISLDEDFYELADDSEIIIPLSLFGLKTPSRERSYSVEVDSSFGLSTSVSVSVVKGLVTEEGIKGELNSIESNLNGLDEDLIKVLGLDGSVNSVLGKLEGYRNDVDDLESKTDLEMQDGLDAINTELDGFLSNIPKDVNVQLEVIYNPIPVSSDYLDVPDSVYSLQGKVEIESTVQLLSVVYYSGIIEKITLFKDSLTSQESSFKIVKFIPKSMASSASEILFFPEPVILNDDPLVEFTVNPSTEILMVIKKDVIDSVDEVSSIYVPLDIESRDSGLNCGNNVCDYREDYTSCPEDCTCGNNVCDSGESFKTCSQDCEPESERSSVIFIVVVVLSIIGVIVTTIVWKFRDKKTPPTGGLEKLRVFIKSAMKKGLSKQTIMDTLIKKGWKKRQVDEAFRKL